MNLGSLLIGSSDVAAMKEWYRAAFAVKENETGAFEFGATRLLVEEHSHISGPAKEPARVILNLDVEDCRAVEAHLRTLDVTWVREVERMPFGLIGTVADPDGDYVQIIQWGADPEARKD